MAEIKAIDFFSGCGGVSCGLALSGFDVVAAVEIESSAVKTYKAYHLLKDVNVLEEDICKLEGAKILEAAKIKNNEIYLLAGCPPCQNFSTQNPNNKNKSAEERKKLLFEFLKKIKEMYPPFILMENVPGIKSTSKDPEDSKSVSNLEILNEFITKLKNETDIPEKRYEVVEDILNAANYGVPQARKRFVLHAVRYDIFLKLQSMNIAVALPKATYENPIRPKAKKKVKDGEAKDNLLPWKTVNEAIGDLPEIDAGCEYNGSDKGIYNHKCAGLTETNLKRMNKIREGGGTRTSLPADMMLECHTKKNDKGKTTGHTDVYGIMNGDKPAPTITGGCLCYSKGRFGHPTQNRAISIREAARLQTFPDDFVFSNSLTKAALQIGNAVPVKLVEASGREFFRYINAILENSVDK